jgi:heme/copper-type cytochrome/quinol oxidase subunit 4
MLRLGKLSHLLRLEINFQGKTMDKLNPLTRGIVLLAALAILTAIEFLIARLESVTILLVLIALLKAGLVLWYFMHLPRVFKTEEEHES